MHVTVRKWSICAGLEHERPGKSSETLTCKCGDERTTSDSEKNANSLGFTSGKTDKRKKATIGGYQPKAKFK